MDEAENCDRIAIIDHGQIVAIDTPENLKASIGKDRVQISTADDGAAIRELKQRFDLGGAVHENLVTFRVASGEQFVPRLFAELPVPIRSVSVARPSLDDVFMSYTGRTIRDTEASATDKNRARIMAFGADHVPYDPILFLTVIGELLLAFTLTAFGVMMAARIKQMQAFMALTQMLVMPLFFLSGALYPLRSLPLWLTVLTRIDPTPTPSTRCGRRSSVTSMSRRRGQCETVALRHLGRLGGPGGPVAGHRRRDGRGSARHGDRRVPAHRVAIAR
jgi:hypothetical protein